MRFEPGMHYTMSDWRFCILNPVKSRATGGSSILRSGQKFLLSVSIDSSQRAPVRNGQELGVRDIVAVLVWRKITNLLHRIEPQDQRGSTGAELDAAWEGQVLLIRYVSRGSTCKGIAHG